MRFTLAEHIRVGYSFLNTKKAEASSWITTRLGLKW